MEYAMGAFLLGALTVMTKGVNFRAAQHLGSGGGAMANYIVATLLSGLLLSGDEDASALMTGFLEAPGWLYWGGVFGVVSFVINIASLRHMNLLLSTGCMLVGQLIGAALTDWLWYQAVVPGKLAGIALLAVGVLYDKWKCCND
ncbi:DMT family transporter [Azotosporobacter soli]|uniref:DMT family transporter n=1 Tax=Azotosporobacter soli TaxID=3055040 RepID=UPI0031FF3203